MQKFKTDSSSIGVCVPLVEILPALLRHAARSRRIIYFCIVSSLEPTLCLMCHTPERIHTDRHSTYHCETERMRCNIASLSRLLLKRKENISNSISSILKCNVAVFCSFSAHSHWNSALVLLKYYAKWIIKSYILVQVLLYIFCTSLSQSLFGSRNPLRKH